jgi:hypothetical protein
MNRGGVLSLSKTVLEFLFACTTHCGISHTSKSKQAIMLSEDNSDKLE